eukprot:CAMPEP_0201881184 /NCGR_PEP_ID=MMETSP0902-20130614/11566_1 /ASSEMBLY_ACC=CAM_ASM_000551 /TAXON_ID=420261 /ORGANISM="Thalassiosira antarctica, Strain CCMP982" /LENGTH=105 /DNA_ID=CAMNT_0048409331 /DNA_START=480 /DNA_END=795 /DNA_ORIENTATION=+
MSADFRIIVINHRKGIANLRPRGAHPNTIPPSSTIVACYLSAHPAITSIGDETYTTIKISTEFTQQFVSSLCLASIKGVMEWKHDGVMKLIQAKAELREVREKMT